MAFAETAPLVASLDLKGNFAAKLKSAQSSLTGFAGAMARAEGGLGRVGKGIGQVGTGLARAGLLVGGAAITGLAGAARNAIEFQDAFAGVVKTVAGSPAELAALNDELRKLSTRIPVSFVDLAGVAAEAGALGVPTKEVANFTEVVSRLSAATVGLTVDAAAEAFGKLGNVLQLHGQDFERMGSSLVALGNAGASSEGDIIEVAKRFGAAGATAKLSAAQVLGFSSAIASMGVEPEAAGSSLSRLFNNITKYIGTGNKKIETFAEVSKMSVKDFSKFFAQDASGAVQTFLTQLSKLDNFQAAKVLKDAGIINVRDINAVLLLARGHEELARQVDLSTDAYAKNTELAAVSAARFDTIKAKITELKNAFTLATVTLGEGLLPALGRTITKLQAFLALDTTTSALKGIGEDIGKAIDNIDWQAVLEGAKEFVGILKGALSFAKTLFDAFSLLPGPIKEATAGFLVLNKLSGGLIGAGGGNIIGGLASTLIKAGASKIPVVGAAFAQPVFVTNWPLGGMGGGLGAGAGAAGAASIWSKVGTVIGGAFAIVAVAALADQVHSAISPGGGLEGRTNTGDLLPTDKLSWPFGPKNTPKWIIDSPFGKLNILGGDSTFTRPPGFDDVRKPRAGFDDVGKPTTVAHPGGVDSPRTSPASLATINAILARGRAAGFHPTFAGAQATNQRNLERLASVQIAATEKVRAAVQAGDTRSELAGIRNAVASAKPPTTNVAVTVNVTAAQVMKSVTIQKRVGPGGGSREHGPTERDI